ncbi:VapA/VapB family virulence-associated protein [Xenorhabdus sp. SGI246]|uniref:VapA/VapB family virulence-associated protein n=1 Tax=Xenorhabdus sp. SGI246 TaxID=3158263 RepID=UPI00349F20CE
MSKVKENAIDLKIIEDLKKDMEGKLEPSIIDDIVEKIFVQENERNVSLGAVGTVESLAFYIRFDIIINSDKKHFQGNAGGWTSPGIGSVLGYVYTDDLDKLYSDTTSFIFQATPLTLFIWFFSLHREVLGQFSGGALSLVSGIGSGSGSWS